MARREDGTIEVFAPGTKVYMQHSCGDHWQGKSVSIPTGQAGIVRGYEANMMVVDLINSPGQPVLKTTLNSSLWGTTAPFDQPPENKSRYRFFGTI